MADVSIVRCKDYSPDEAKRALCEAIGAVGGLDFVKPGMKIVIKANLVSAKKPDAAATTHPVLISELVKMLTKRGASVVVGDSPGGLFNAAWLNGVYSATGMKLCEQAGATLNHNFSQTQADCGGKVLHDFKFTSYLKEADVIIDFAKLKTHGMMVMTGAVKNLFGAIPGVAKPEYHSRFPNVENFADMLVDLYEFFKPTLCLIDAVFAMEGNGPTAGSPKYVGALIASQNGHFADMVGAHIMGLELKALPLYCSAFERGLCPESLEKLDIYGNIDEFCVTDFNLICNASADFSKVLPKGVAWLSSKVFSTKPILKPKLCVGCKVCFNTCPKHAIEMKDGKPKFDYKKCIRCFCCQEFCPKGALHVKRTAIAKILNR